MNNDQFYYKLPMDLKFYNAVATIPLVKKQKTMSMVSTLSVITMTLCFVTMSLGVVNIML